MKVGSILGLTIAVSAAAVLPAAASHRAGVPSVRLIHPVKPPMVKPIRPPRPPGPPRAPRPHRLVRAF